MLSELATATATLSLREMPRHIFILTMPDTYDTQITIRD